MASPDDSSEEVVEVGIDDIRKIQCANCDTWQRMRAEVRGGAQRCHRCGSVLWAAAELTARAGGWDRLRH